MISNPFKQVRELQRALAAAEAEIAQLARDCVSGLLGRSSFEKHLEGMFTHSRRNAGPIGIVMCDIDNFKRVNDEYGHMIGDAVINRVAACIQGCTRVSDIVARYGGEEFVCIAVNADRAGIALLSERIRASVEDLKVPGLPQVTVSVGYALQDTLDASGWDIVDRADQALYRAKRAGRNRVEGEIMGNSEIKLLVRCDRALQEQR